VDSRRRRDPSRHRRRKGELESGGGAEDHTGSRSAGQRRLAEGRRALEGERPPGSAAAFKSALRVRAPRTAYRTAASCAKAPSAASPDGGRRSAERVGLPPGAAPDQRVDEKADSAFELDRLRPAWGCPTSRFRCRSDGRAGPGRAARATMKRVASKSRDEPARAWAKLRRQVPGDDAGQRGLERRAARSGRKRQLPRPRAAAAAASSRGARTARSAESNAALPHRVTATGGAGSARAPPAAARERSVARRQLAEERAEDQASRASGGP